MKFSKRFLVVSAIALCLGTGCGNGTSTSNVPRAQPQQPAPIQQPVDLRPVQTAAQAAQAAAERAATAAQAAQAAAEQARDARQAGGNPACNPNEPAYHAANADCDDDGVLNADDACIPISAGDHPDQTHARRGCPAPDTDGDGVFDNEDRCRETPKGDHQHSLMAGCPDTDTDGDGVWDHNGDESDQCRTIPVRSTAHPNAPEADSEHQGCPPNATRDVDNDGDGFIDSEDQCPNEAMGDNADPTRRGCNDIDTDHDGVLDHAHGENDRDWCPTTPVRSDNTASAPVANAHWPGCPENMTHDPEQNQPAPTPMAVPTAPAPTPTTITSVATLPENMVATRRVMATLGDRTAVITRLCAPRNSDQLMAATGPCAANEPYCFRLVPHATLAPCNTSAMTPGCVMASRTIDPCVDGAERVLAIQCGSSLIGCTPENVATVAAREGERPTREQRTASRSRHRRHGIFVGWNGVTWR